MIDGQLVKGHGTANDFVLLHDPHGEHTLDPAGVRALADRHTGIGGDGVIRVIRSAALGEEAGDVAHDGGAEWFMDYRNADGSIAEMCGNGVRVFAHYLRTYGLVQSQSFAVGTRAGIKHVTVIADPLGGDEPWYKVDMGKWQLPGGGEAFDATVETPGVRVARPGLTVDMGNPHTVVALAHAEELEAAKLHEPPHVEPVPPAGTNVEYIVIEPDNDPTTGTLRMRVHERGVGETHACGTGACASALAAYVWAGRGPQAPTTWTVHQPGGAVRIDITGETVALSGPAVITYEVTPRDLPVL